jgi:hypothetical protein
VKKFSAFTGLEERYRSKILLPLGLLAESSRQTGYGDFHPFSGAVGPENREENLMYPL